MKRFITFGSAALMAAVLIFQDTDNSASAAGPDSVSIGYAISLSGPFAPGAGATQWPNYKLWVKDMNDAGGIYLSKYNKKVPVKLFAYDDQSKIENAVRLTEKMMLQDKIDFILPPWGTGMHLAVAPLYQKHGYPMCGTTAASEKMAGFSKRWPNAFWMGGAPSWITGGVVDLVADLVKSGKINNKVAMVSVAEQFGAEMRVAGQKQVKAAGLNLVYDKSYPLGVKDLAPQLQEIKRLGADTFLSMSYPPDAMLITGQSIGLKFNAKIWFGGVGPAFGFFQKAYGPNAEGIIGVQAWDPTPKAMAWFERHKKLVGYGPDRGASISVYACMQLIEAAIKEAGEVDRKKAIEMWKTKTIETVMGPVKFDKNNIRARASHYYAGQYQDGIYVPVSGGTKSRPVKFKPDFVAKKK